MNRRACSAFPAIMLSLLVMGGWCSAAEKGVEAQPKAAAGGADATDEAWTNRWFVVWGPANVHAQLWESENQINHQINGTLGLIIPGWERPTTFRDWSDDMLLWDFHFGAGRDLGPKFSWFVDVGGVLGTIKTADNYWLVAPLDSRVAFSRTVWFVAAGMDFYLFGKPRLVKTDKGCGLLQALKATRPYIEFAAGHVHANEAAKVRLKISGTNLGFSKDEFLHHDVDYVSPRVGVEMPVTENDSISLQAGYLFFDRHASDFNNLSVYLLHKHRF